MDATARFVGLDRVRRKVYAHCKPSAPPGQHHFRHARQPPSFSQISVAPAAGCGRGCRAGHRSAGGHETAALERPGEHEFDPNVHAYLGYFDIFEPFGHGIGVALVLVVLHQLDPARRWAIPRVAACALAAGGVADLLKMRSSAPALTTFRSTSAARFGTRSAAGCRCSAAKAARRASPRPTRPPPSGLPPP